MSITSAIAQLRTTDMIRDDQGHTLHIGERLPADRHDARREEENP